MKKVKHLILALICCTCVFTVSATVIDSIVAKNNRLITSFLDGKIAESEAGRAKFWHRDFSSESAYEKSVEQNRERLKFITGVRDKRTPFDAPELCATLEHTAVVAQTATHETLAVCWQVFDDFFAEGLLLKPKKQAKQTTVYLSYAGITPEQLLGLEKSGFEPWFRFPSTKRLWLTISTVATASATSLSTAMCSACCNSLAMRK